MELDYESDSEIINSKNNYKFDNYGIVMADSIEDLLYDKYYCMKKKRKGHNSSSSNKEESSESEKKEEESNTNINNIKNEVCSDSDKKKENKLNDKEDNDLNRVKENNKRNNLKIMRCKDFEIKNSQNYINKDRNKNRKIKIIFNVNNKEKKEIEINPYDTNLIKKVNIKANEKDLWNKKENKNIENNKALENKDNKKNIESKYKKSLYYNDLINNKNNDIKKRLSSDKMNLQKYSSKNELLRKNLNGIKNKYLKENIKNDNHVIKLNVNLIKKNKSKKYLIHNIPISSQCYIEKIRKNKNVLFHKAIPKLNRVFITKSYIQREKDTKNKNNKKNKNILNIPNSSMCYFTKKLRIINVYSHIPLQNVVNDIYFTTKEILDCSTDIMNNKKLAHKNKNYLSKADDDDEKCDIKNYHTSKEENKKYSRYKGKKIKIYKKLKIGKNKDNQYFNKNSNNDNNNNNNMPNIIIKILNSSNKKNYGGKNYIRSNSSTINSRNSNLGKSKLLKRINDSTSVFNLKNNNNNNNNSNNNNPYLLPLKLKKLRNINSHHYRYDSKNKSEPDFHNKEIVSALNINPRYKSNCPACFVLTRNTKFQDEFDRNMQLKSMKISKSEKNMKIKPLAMMEFKNNFKKDFRNNLRNNLILSQNKEEMTNNNKIENMFSQSKTKFVNYYRNNNQIKNSIDSNIGFSLFNKNSYFTYLEFPAIDSYFH